MASDGPIESGVRPKKSLGQNFLEDPDIAARIVDALAPTRDDAVVEIGPGTGRLTDLLVRQAGSVTAVEIDHSLLRLLQERFADRKNLALILGDARKFDFEALGKEKDRKLLVLGNLPYYISTEFLYHLLDQAGAVDRAVLTFQTEVADRLLSSPCSKDYGSLTVMVRAAAKVEKVMDIPSSAFHPRPQVGSTTLCMRFPVPAPHPTADPKLFKQIVRAGFGQRRKTLRNALTACVAQLAPRLDTGEFLKSSGIDPMRRAETLSVVEWAMLADKLHANKTSL